MSWNGVTLKYFFEIAFPGTLILYLFVVFCALLVEMSTWQKKLDSNGKLRASDGEDDEEDEGGHTEPVVVRPHPDSGALITFSC